MGCCSQIHPSVAEADLCWASSGVGSRAAPVHRRGYPRSGSGQFLRRNRQGVADFGDMTGQLPPGWDKKIEPFPASLERECAPLPAGYRRGVIDAQAVIYNSRGTIIDVVVLF